MRLLRGLELSRKESFEQLRKDKEQSDLRIQEHIQRLEVREQEREARKRGHSRHNPSQEKQTPKITKFKGENDRNIYIEWDTSAGKGNDSGYFQLLTSGLQPLHIRPR